VSVQQTGSVGMIIVLFAMVMVRTRGVAIALTMEILFVGVVSVMMIGTMLS